MSPPAEPDVRALSPGTALGAYLMTFIAVPVCAALVVAIAMSMVHHRLAHPAIGLGDYRTTSIFMLFMLALLGISFRAWNRTRKVGARAREASWLARAVPGLAIAGALLGAWLGRTMNASADETDRELARFECDELLGAPVDRARQQACVRIVIQCSDEALEAERVSGQHPMYTDREARPEVVCERARLGLPAKSRSEAP